MSILDRVEVLTAKWRGNFFTIAVSLIIFLVVFLVMDNHFNYLQQMPKQASVGLGKILGKLSLLTFLLAVLYYILRRAYTYSTKRNVSVFLKRKQQVMKLIKILRHLHPVVGLFCIIFMTAHAYMLWDLAAVRALAFDSGVLAGVFLLCITLSGIYLLEHSTTDQIRTYHRILGYCVTAFVIAHMVLT